MADEPPINTRQNNDRVGIAMIVTAVAIAAIVVFVFQNLEPVKVQFFVFSITFPLWLVALVFLALGVVLGWIWRWISRRRKRR